MRVCRLSSAVLHPNLHPAVTRVKPLVPLPLACSSGSQKGRLINCFSEHARVIRVRLRFGLIRQNVTLRTPAASAIVAPLGVTITVLPVIFS